MTPTVAETTRWKQCVGQRSLEDEVIVRITGDTADLGGLEAEERHLALSRRVEDVGPIPGFREEREILAQAAGRGVGQEAFRVEADVMETRPRQGNRRRVLERIRQARVVGQRRQQ